MRHDKAKEHICMQPSLGGRTMHFNVIYDPSCKAIAPECIQIVEAVTSMGRSAGNYQTGLSGSPVVAKLCHTMESPPSNCTTSASTNYHRCQPPKVRSDIGQTSSCRAVEFRTVTKVLQLQRIHDNLIGHQDIPYKNHKKDHTSAHRQYNCTDIYSQQGWSLRRVHKNNKAIWSLAISHKIHIQVHHFNEVVKFHADKLSELKDNWMLLFGLK